MAIIRLEGLEYDKDIHGYILDKNYFTIRTAMTLEDILDDDNSSGIDAVVEAYLKRASVILYDYIYSFSKDIEYTQYRLCHEEMLVNTIREALIEQVNYWVLNGLDSNILNPILNIDVTRSAPVLTTEQLEAAAIPLSVRRKIKNAKLTKQWAKELYDPKILEEYKAEEAAL